GTKAVASRLRAFDTGSFERESPRDKRLASLSTFCAKPLPTVKILLLIVYVIICALANHDSRFATILPRCACDLCDLYGVSHFSTCNVNFYGAKIVSVTRGLGPQIDTVGVCGSNPHAPTISLSSDLNRLL